MKRIMSLTVVLCLLMAIFVQANAEVVYVGRMMVTNCKSSVSLRSGPSQDSDRLSWVPYHTVVENCYSGYGEYCYVEYDGIPGYIHTDYLEAYAGDDVFEAVEYSELQIVNCPVWTPLREMADVDSEMLAKLPAGAVVYNCCYYGDDYTYVEYNGEGGYVLTEYLATGTDNTSEPLLGTKYVSNCEIKVSLREAPDSDSERLAWVPKDAQVEAYDAQDGYFYVEYDGMYGYVFGDYLSQFEDSEEYAAVYAGNMMVTNCKKCVSLRAEPTSESERLAWVDYHTVVSDCYSGYGEYYLVDYDGVYGYIHSDYLEPYYGDVNFTVQSYDIMQVVGCPEWTPLREMAKTDADILFELPAGAIVTNCIFYADTYTYVEYNGMGGYVLTEYLTLGSGNNIESSLGTKIVTNCNIKVSLRAEPDSDSERLAWVPKDTLLEALHADDGYFYVEYDGMYGYVFGDYLADYYDLTISFDDYTDDYSDAYTDDHADGFRSILAENGAAFGVYLISGSMGGEWSVLSEKNHLQNVIAGMPESLQAVANAIPDERIIEIIGGCELYLIIPAETSFSVDVNRLELGYDGFTGNVEEVLYSSWYGDPILVRCNVNTAAQDCEILIGNAENNVVAWYPGTDIYSGSVYTGAYNGTCYDFTEYAR